MDRRIHGKRLSLREIAAVAFAIAHCTSVIAGDEVKTASVVSADAFGADSTGRSDSTDAIARAIRAVTDRGGGKVEFGPGSYNVAGTITDFRVRSDSGGNQRRYAYQLYWKRRGRLAYR